MIICGILITRIIISRCALFRELMRSEKNLILRFYIKNGRAVSYLKFIRLSFCDRARGASSPQFGREESYAKSIPCRNAISVSS
ncbi:hypothetical protein PUN28_009622 [Cardiocondyla obscurior]|uniref:Uncharacterized protein n=1 Tax=Cardiocondyla obscurior TaxID=286306 RepID=A0AAW2FT41_9HYME